MDLPAPVGITASTSCPPSRRVRNWLLYHSTVSPESSAAGWERGSRLNCTLDFSNVVPLVQRTTQRRSLQRNRVAPMPHSTTSTASSSETIRLIVIVHGRCTSSTSSKRPHSTARLAVSISSVHLGLRFIGFLPPQTLHRLAVRPDQTSIRMGRIIGLRLVRR